MECLFRCSGSSRVSVGRFSNVPLASDTRFSNAAAGLKALGLTVEQIKGMDPAAFQGLARSGEFEFGYQGIPNFLIDHAMRNPHVPPGFWRGVNINQNAVFIECFMDELAEAAGKDPVEFRRAMLGKSEKDLGILNAVVKAADWGKPLPKGFLAFGEVDFGNCFHDIGVCLLCLFRDDAAKRANIRFRIAEQRKGRVDEFRIKRRQVALHVDDRVVVLAGVDTGERLEDAIGAGAMLGAGQFRGPAGRAPMRWRVTAKRARGPRPTATPRAPAG